MSRRRRHIQTWWFKGIPYRVKQMETAQLVEFLAEAKRTLLYIQEHGCSPKMWTATEVAIKSFERKLKKRELI